MLLHNTPIEVYLSGPIEYAFDNGKHWREEAEESFSNEVNPINPLDFHDVDEHTEIVEGPCEDHTVVTDKDIVRTDKQCIEYCDVVLVNWRTTIPVAGTPMEIMYAYDRGTPVVVWHSDRVREEISPWVRYHANFLSESLDDCIRYIEEHYREDDG